jgi:hypothetical protein
MGSPLYPLIANFFMEDVEKKVLEQVTRNPICWFITFIIWPYGRVKLTEFLNHVSGFYTCIQFTLEKEGHCPFLDIDIYRKMDGFLGHRVYQKSPTPIYIYTRIHIVIPQKSVLTSLITDPKLSVTRIPLFKNWNFSPQFARTMDTALSRYDPLKLATQTAKTSDRPTSILFIPYTQTSYSQLSRILAKHKIQSVSLPPGKIYSYLLPV